MKRNISSLFIGLSIIAAAAIISVAYINRNKAAQQISVTGLGTFDFTSDLVVWKGRFTQIANDMSSAYELLERDREVITDYLIKRGLEANDFIFTAIHMEEEFNYIYDNQGNRIKEFVGYRMHQGIEIESGEVDKIEELSRDISTIIKKGVQFSSDHPQYYYTKLSELKIEMIAKATEDGRIRAEQIALNSNAKLGNLKEARMGVFQIIGKNSNEDYSLSLIHISEPTRPY